MRRKKKRRKSYRQALILLVIVGIIIVIAALYQSQLNPESNETRIPAKDYFKIYNATYIGNKKDSVLLVDGLIFQLEAVGGTATDVIVNNVGMGLADPYYLGDMTKGEPTYVYLQFPTPIRTILEEEGFPISIPIICNEAEGRIDIYLTP